MKKILVSRRICQCLVILLFVLVPWLNKQDYHGIQGSLFSFELFGVPFADPASATQALLSGALQLNAQVLPHILGALFSLCIALLLGRIFCGWICPYGLCSELLHSLRVKTNTPLPPKRREIIWICKSIFVFLALFGAFLFAWPLVTLFSMPGQMSLIPVSLWFHMGAITFIPLVVIPVVALLCEVIAKRRIWCQYMCPQSIFLGLSAWILPKFAPGLRIQWTPKKCDCGKANPCAAACPMNLNPRHKDGPPRRDCTMCGDCVEACKKCGGALGYEFKKEN